MSTPPERLMVARGDGTMRSETDAEWWTRQLGSVVATMDRSHLRSSARRLVGLRGPALSFLVENCRKIRHMGQKCPTHWVKNVPAMARLTTARRPAFSAGPPARRSLCPTTHLTPKTSPSMHAQLLPSPVDPRDGGDAA